MAGLATILKVAATECDLSKIMVVVWIFLGTMACDRHAACLFDWRYWWLVSIGILKHGVLLVFWYNAFTAVV